jgi:hypothetical protein
MEETSGYGVSTQVIDGRSVWRRAGPSINFFSSLFQPSFIHINQPSQWSRESTIALGPTRTHPSRRRQNHKAMCTQTLATSCSTTMSSPNTVKIMRRVDRMSHLTSTSILKPCPDSLQLPPHCRLWLDQRLPPPIRPPRDHRQCPLYTKGNRHLQDPPVRRPRQPLWSRSRCSQAAAFDAHPARLALLCRVPRLGLGSLWCWRPVRKEDGYGCQCIRSRLSLVVP